MPTHFTKLPSGASLPAPAGLEDGYPYIETVNGRLYYIASGAFVPVASGQMVSADYGAAHTLTQADLGKRLRITATMTLTLPEDTTEDLDLHFPVHVFVQTGTLTVDGDVGATLVNNTGPYTVGSTIHAVKDAANTWVLY